MDWILKKKEERLLDWPKLLIILCKKSKNECKNLPVTIWKSCIDVTTVLVVDAAETPSQRRQRNPLLLVFL